MNYGIIQFKLVLSVTQEKFQNTHLALPFSGEWQC